MIDVRELRIGNYVQFYRKIEDQDPSQASICSIFETDGDYYVKFEDGFCVNTERGIKAIPITEELLLKSGFEKHKWGILTFYNPLIELDCNFCLKGVDYNIQIQSLHQLQNIYFALTGKELEVSL